jgi:thiol-disulfide isomerase/thioredoxin
MNRLCSVLLCSVVVLAQFGCTPKKEPSTPPPPKVSAAPMALPVVGPAPMWELKDLEGKPVRWSDFKGKVVVVDLWATWCAPCKEEIPGYISLVKKYGPEGLAVVGISLDQAGVDVVKAFVAKNQMNYPVVMMEEKAMAAFGDVEAIPTTFLIDRNGQVRDRKVGAEPTAEYEKKILALLKS